MILSNKALYAFERQLSYLQWLVIHIKLLPLLNEALIVPFPLNQSYYVIFVQLSILHSVVRDSLIFIDLPVYHRLNREFFIIET
jgi:hypothetical protein